MKLKHWIVVRFFNQVFKKHTVEDVLSDQSLSSGMKLLKSNLLKSLDNQTCKEFEVVLLVHQKLAEDSKWFHELSKLDEDHEFKIHVITSSQLAALVAVKDEDKRIISRVDYDDLILDVVVSDTQAFAELHQKKPLCIYGYNYGYAWRDDTKRLYEIDKNYKRFGGHFSAMQSVILDCAGADTKLHQVQPYLWDHSAVMKYFDSQTSMSRQDIELRYNLNVRAYVWMRHKNAGSVEPYLIKADRVQLVSDKDIISALDFETYFGKKLEVKV